MDAVLSCTDATFRTGGRHASLLGRMLSAVSLEKLPLAAESCLSQGQVQPKSDDCSMPGHYSWFHISQGLTDTLLCLRYGSASPSFQTVFFPLYTGLKALSNKVSAKFKKKKKERRKEGKKGGRKEGRKKERERKEGGKKEKKKHHPFPEIIYLHLTQKLS